jgi:DNA-directed RNA polymerase specialized sigma24 family protein
MGVPVIQVDLGSTLALVERAREGDREALELIAERYRAVLTRFAHGRLPPHARGLADTGDLVQVAIVRMLDRLEGFEPSF